MAKVLVVDDGEIGRLGRVALIERSGHEVLGTDWAGVDDGSFADLLGVEVVLAALRADPGSWDRFACLGALGRLRERLAPDARVVGLLWGSALDNPLLGLRIAAAGVTEVLDHDQAAGGDALEAILTGRLEGADPRPTKRDLAFLGVGPTADPDAVVAWVLAQAEAEPEHLAAFEPGRQQNQCGLSRRRAHRLRRQIAALGSVRADPARLGGGPVKDQSLPRWTELIAIANLCRGEHFDEVPRRLEPRGFGDGGWWTAACN